MASILIAEDDRANRLLMQFVLEVQGGHHVRAADSAASAMQLIEAAVPDVLVLDVVMPGDSGLDLCRRLRRGGGLPILMVSGRGDPAHRVEGLRSGADDYLSKPFDPAELLERVNALLRRSRRSESGPDGAAIRAGDLRLHLIDHQLWVGDRGPISLTQNECRLLYVMLSRPNEVWTRVELLSRLWDAPDSYGGTSTAIESYVTRLRRKLEHAPRRPAYLRTVRGKGYLLRPAGGR